MHGTNQKPGRTEDRYRELLHRHLVDRPASEVDFFVNAQRFDIMRETLIPQLHGQSVLNVASGPFAFEFYTPEIPCRIDSIDIDPLLPDLHAELVAEGLITPSTFTCSDVMSFDTDKRYDVILINDLFYTRYVDFYAVMARYVGFLKPGGRIYFDILDQRAGPVWRLFNKDANYRRYDMQSVRETLASHDLHIEVETPSPGIKGGFDGLLRRGMWASARIANNFIFMARKSTLAMAFCCLFGGAELFDVKKPENRYAGHNIIVAMG